MEDRGGFDQGSCQKERKKEETDEEQQKEDKRKRNINKIQRCVLGKHEVESHQGPVS